MSGHQRRHLPQAKKETRKRRRSSLCEDLRSHPHHLVERALKQRIDGALKAVLLILWVPVGLR
ncbi:hypothetical protein ACFU51_36855 [Streptomyces sp. NPDC057430]|uniref:hypothetical protein n=1 Tax=Streptomyces sp. NPDC057430 TaxID=3346131 RepID=UPI0036C80ECC